jgi:hypothetical protein
VGTLSSIETVTVVNNGNLPLNIGTVVAPSAPFTLDDACSNESLDQGVDCNIRVQFSPTTTGTFTDTLSIPSNDPETPTVIVSLTGNGVLVPEPDVSVSPMTNDFGYVLVGDSSPELVVTISNVGSGDIDVSDISLVTGTEYSLDVSGGGAGSCGSTSPTITPGGNCTVSVTFSPQSVGTFTDTLRITSDDPDEPTVDVSLTGNGVNVLPPDIRVFPPLAIDFGRVEVEDGRGWVVTIYNEGSTDLAVSNISLVKWNEYTIYEDEGPNPCDIRNPTIMPGDNCTVRVVFASETRGTYTDTLKIYSNDPDEPTVDVSLTAIAFKPSDSSFAGCLFAMSRPEGEIPIGPIAFLVLITLVLLWWRGIRRS